MGVYFYLAVAAAVISLIGIILLVVYLLKTAPDKNLPGEYQMKDRSGSGGYNNFGGQFVNNDDVRTQQIPGGSMPAQHTVQQFANEINKIMFIGQSGDVHEKTIHDTLNIGRSSSNDFVVGDPRTSGTHCRIIKMQGDLYIEDRSSSNGTYVNDRRIYERVRLNSGDKVVFGNIGYTVRF